VLKVSYQEYWDLEEAPLIIGLLEDSVMSNLCAVSSGNGCLALCNHFLLAQSDQDQEPP
jgi:hypothetical protein